MALKCPKCHTNNPDTVKFCSECGTPFDVGIARTKTLETPTQELTLGSTFAGRYQIIEKLGEGGMGKVFKALDTEINEDVAVKLLKSGIAEDKSTIGRFRNELKLARRIAHKNVCKMYHFATEGGTPYITMEYVPGKSLKDFFTKKGNLSEEKAIEIAQQICLGLSEAHALKVVHRDLKPSNIMIDTKGNVKILDFGIARSLMARGITQTGRIIGTPDYMSSEQAEGIKADQRSDIYSLGIILYEMVTGQVPFKGDSALSVALKHKTEIPTDPRELNDKVTEGLSAVILKCLEKQRERRYQSAEELLSELENVKKGIFPDTAPPQPQVPAFLAEAEEEVIEKEKPIFVDREQEMALLGKYLITSLSGKGQVVFIKGEAGSGKTALIQEFARRAQEENSNLIVASGKCNAQTGIGDPYLPFIDILSLLTGDVETKRMAGVLAREQALRLWNLIPIAAKAILDKGPDLIDTFVPGFGLVSRCEASNSDRASWVFPLKKFVDRKASLPPDSMLQQSHLFEQYSRVVEALAQQQPLLLFLDDLQWVDAGSASLLFHLGRRIAGCQILIVGAFRPSEVAEGRKGERHPLEFVLHELKRDFGDFEVELGEAEDRPFTDAFLDSEPNQFGAEFRNTFFKQTKGHPLFTIELLRDMKQRGVLVKDKRGQWVEGPELNWDTLPVRVDAVIEERISRLTEELREVLVLASVEGEEFTAEVVARQQKMEVRKLIKLLSSELDKRHHLVSAKGTRQLEKQRLSFYLFQHILFQRYLYNSLDEVERIHLHEQVGNVLETLYGDQAEEIAVQLARHFQEAGVTEKAIDYLKKAGDKAVRLSANAEAIAHFTRSLVLLETLPDTPEHAQQELLLQLALAAPLMASRGYAAPELGRAYTRARTLCQKIGETPQLIPALGLLVSFHGTRGDTRTAREIGEQLLSVAELTEDPLPVAVAHWLLGWILVFLGEPAPALAHLEHVINFYDPQRHRSLAFIYGQDPGVSCLSWSAWALWFLGYPDLAFKRSQDALALAQELNHPFTLGFALAIAGAMFHEFRREDQGAREYSEAEIQLATEEGFVLFQAEGTISRGQEQIERGKVEEGIAQMRQGMAAWQATGAGMIRPQRLALLAEAYGRAGKLEEGLTVLSEALAAAQSSGERYYEAEIFRLKGELLLMQGDEAEAEISFLKAVEVARQQSAKSWELRTAVSLCRLWQKQGKKEEALKKLKEIYNLFTEGFDTLDLKEAKALLEELS
ncbi:MAG: protein kinase [Candidatus Aminicenantes bacterium]